jgi:hypothetical protein
LEVVQEQLESRPPELLPVPEYLDLAVHRP